MQGFLKRIIILQTNETSENIELKVFKVLINVLKSSRYSDFLCVIHWYTGRFSQHESRLVRTYDCSIFVTNIIAPINLTKHNNQTKNILNKIAETKQLK